MSSPTGLFVEPGPEAEPATMTITSPETLATRPSATSLQPHGLGPVTDRGHPTSPLLSPVTNAYANRFSRRLDAVCSEHSSD